jgi:uncharacterized protein (DUF4415 family)
MKQQKGVKRPGKVSRLKASAGGKRPPGPLPEWLGHYRPIKKVVTLRLDADVLAWFQRQGRGYQTRINRALRRLMSEEREISSEGAGEIGDNVKKRFVCPLDGLEGHFSRFLRSGLPADNR